MTYDEVMQRLRSMGSEHDRQGMGRFGINVAAAYGISVNSLRKLAREIGTDHQLAMQLWDSGIHEARILASFVADPAQLTESEQDRWVADINSWDLCDQACGLFLRSPLANQKALEWTQRDEEFVRRAGFVLIAKFAVHDKASGDDMFEGFLPFIRAGAADDRNFVNKAVNWALRNIGKRNRNLNRLATALALELKESSDRSSRRVGSVSYRELTSEKVQERLQRIESQ